MGFSSRFKGALVVENKDKKSKAPDDETLQDALDEALKLLQAGRYAEAESIYRNILGHANIKPKDGELGEGSRILLDAFNNLGISLQLQNKMPEAIECYRQAIVIDSTYADAHSNLGAALQRQGVLDEAVSSFRRALEINPAHGTAPCNLGVVLQSQGKFEEAESYCLLSIENNPKNPEAYNVLGNTLLVAGRLDEAVDRYQEALAISPGFLDACCNLGTALQRLKRFDESIRVFQQGIDISPHHPLAHNNLGISLKALGRLDEAIACYRSALEFAPNYIDALCNLGNALLEQGRLDEAIVSCRRALELEPKFVEALNVIGSALQEKGDLYEGDASFRRAYELAPENTEALNNFGAVLDRQGDIDGAIECWLKILDVAPEHSRALNNLGIAMVSQGKLNEGVAYYQRAMASAPDYAEAFFNYSLALLVQGDFENGWANYSRRLERRDVREDNFRFSSEVWDGAPLRGKTILIHAEQGLGDTLQFVRYGKDVAARGGRVILECHPAQKSLLLDISGFDAVIGKGESLPEYETHVSLLSLPRIFGTNLDSIPADVPYLSSPIGVAIPGNLHLEKDRLKVGLAWAGNPNHLNDRNRSIPLEKFDSLLKLKGIKFYSLQVGSSVDDIARLSLNEFIEDLSPKLTDFAATAAAVDKLDLVISVDTSIVHLAGAMARPVWTLLPLAPDWRWLLGRDDSPWYPTMRLFRQGAIEDWESVLVRVGAALEVLAKNG